MPVRHFEAVDSTNAEAMRLAVSGERGPLWITADRQSAGRGRLARAWASPLGNLSATLLFQPACAPEVLHQLALVTGVSVAESLSALLAEPSAPGCILKWPNDVLIDGAKVCGILVETTAFGRDLVAAIGIGVNVNVAPDVGAAYRATSLKAAGADVAPAAVQAMISRVLMAQLGVWQGGAGFAAIRHSWLQRAHPVGTALTVSVSGETISGAFEGLSADGALLLRDQAGNVRRFTYGDVAVGRVSDAPDNGSR